ncbi:hypothetical protein KDL44_09770 [bacterium]|nr:hypothetical protein [bacterium]
MLLLTAAASAAKRPGVDELVRRAIESLENTSYEARMRYSDPYGNGQEKLVEIIFLSPSSFRVQPLISEKQKAGYYYIENAEHLVKVFQDGQNVVEMPERQFIIDNLMRRKLLETLAGRRSVNLLKGVFNGEPVWILRDEGSVSGSFSITIHLSEKNDFPLSLEMTAQDGRRVQFYEMEQISFLDAADIPEETFLIPEGSLAQRGSNAAPPRADVNLPEQSGSGGDRQSLEYMPRSARRPAGPLDDGAMEEDDEERILRVPLPMLPGWLPEGFRLNEISPLDYSEGGEPMLVYQLELYNPFNENVINIFETRSTELEELFDAGRSVGGEGYFVGSRDEGWLVAVFGSISRSQFEQILNSLELDDEQALEVMSRTRTREELREWAEEVCTPETHKVP